MMQFSNYNAFRVAVQNLFEGDDDAGNTFNVNTLDLIIGLGEVRVYRGDSATPGLRASTMVKPLALAVTDNAVALPADLLELKEAFFSGQPPLDVIGLDRLRALEAGDDRTGANTRYCAQDGDTLRFWPAADGTLAGSYYARPAALETAVWANATTFARYPELFLYSALYEGAIFLGMQDKVMAWEVKYRQLADGANRDERMRAYAGGLLKMRTR
jgi:hypothetical protein